MLIPCGVSNEKQHQIREYAEALREAAHSIGSHGLTREQFEASGLFQAAIERIRGTKSATMMDKRLFILRVLDHLKKLGEIAGWESSGGRDRHDYEITFPDQRVSVIEAKGCLDGNNTTIFTRPPNADEFVIWSLCQNPGANMEKNVWSGIHTRLGPEMMASGKHVDGLIVWDGLCGTEQRICPKLLANPTRATDLGFASPVPPPCLYLFPRTIPDYRNNPNPAPWPLKEIRIMEVLHRVFKGDQDDTAEVRFEAQHNGKDVTRITRICRAGVEMRVSKAQEIRRAKG